MTQVRNYSGVIDTMWVWLTTISPMMSCDLYMTSKSKAHVHVLSGVDKRRDMNYCNEANMVFWKLGVTNLALRV